MSTFFDLLDARRTSIANFIRDYLSLLERRATNENITQKEFVEDLIISDSLKLVGSAVDEMDWLTISVQLMKVVKRYVMVVITVIVCLASFLHGLYAY